MQFFLRCKNSIHNIRKWIKGKKKKSLKEEITNFAMSAFRVKERPAFLALSLIFLLLPGSNYYLDLKLTPQKPLIRSIPIEIETPSKYPVRNTGSPEPYVSAQAAVVIDNNSAAVLFSKNPNQQLLPASTTKIMTALVALEHFPLNKIVTVKRADRSKGQTMDLVTGEKMTVENLLYGLLMHSGNDAAFALAENFDGGYYAFVEEMNSFAKRYHLTNTQFQNVSGIDQKDHYSTVIDLARLAAVAMKNPIFANIVSTEKKTVTDIHGEIVHFLNNRNQLLGLVEGIQGVKTGWTEQAGECLVTDTIRNGNEIITVVLGSNDRFGESQALIEWAYRVHEWREPKI